MELNSDERVPSQIGVVAVDRYGTPYCGYTRKMGVKVYYTRKIAMAAVARKVSRSPWTFVPAYIEVQHES